MIDVPSKHYTGLVQVLACKSNRIKKRETWGEDKTALRMCTGVGRVIVISRAQIENLTTEYDGTFCLDN